MSADVDKLRALEAAASGAPWRFVNDGTTVDITSGERIIAGVWDYDCAGIQYRSDAVFIAAARNALPSLLDEIERLRAENAELRRLLNGKAEA